MMNELDNILNSIGMESLSEEELQELKETASREFDELPGVDFKEHDKDNEENINNDFDVTRTVLTNNINNVEKLTNLLMNQVKFQPENPILVGNVISVISEQNKQIKLLHELHNKKLINKQLNNKVENPDSKDKGNKLPAGFNLK